MPANSPHIPDPAFAEEQSLTTHPAYLYVLTFPDGVSAFTTSWEAPVSVANLPARHNGADPQTFTPGQLSHGPAKKSADLDTGEVQITAGSDDPDLRQFFVTAAAVSIAATIIRCNTEKLMTGDAINYDLDCYPVTGGQLGSISLSGPNIVADFIPAPFGITAGVPRYFFQRLCNHSLGSEACGVDLEAMKWETTITGFDRGARYLLLDGIQAGTSNGSFYQGGNMLHVPTGMRSGIVSGGETGGNSRIHLNYWNAAFTVADDVTVYPGCNRTHVTCRDKFSNEENFGGFPYIPNRNPAIHGAR